MALHRSKSDTARLVGLLGLRTQLSTCQQAFPSGVRKDRQHYLRGEESLLVTKEDTTVCSYFFQCPARPPP